jgi:hypothetical protein
MGDFSRLSPADRVRYLATTCRSLGLNPLTLPIQIMKIDGKEVMYARAECAAQLRARDKVSIKIMERTLDREHGCFVVVAMANTPDGRQYEASGLVSVFQPEKLKEWRNGQSVYVANPNAGKEMTGQDFANARKKAETQATRRATLGLCGLGIPDESDLNEIESVSVAPLKTGELLPGGETVSDIAARLNAGLSKVEKEAVDVAPVTKTEYDRVMALKTDAERSGTGTFVLEIGEATATPVAAAGAPEPVQPATTAPVPVATAEATPAPATDTISEDEQTWRNVETVISENPNAKRYLVAKNHLKDGASVRTLDMVFAGKILAHPQRFHAAVESWAKGTK